MEQDLLAAIAPYFCANAGLVVRLKSEKDFIQLIEILWCSKSKIVIFQNPKLCFETLFLFLVNKSPGPIFWLLLENR